MKMRILPMLTMAALAWGGLAWAQAPAPQFVGGRRTGSPDPTTWYRAPRSRATNAARALYGVPR